MNEELTDEQIEKQFLDALSLMSQECQYLIDGEITTDDKHLSELQAAVTLIREFLEDAKN